jgi:hypothetical protein
MTRDNVASLRSSLDVVEGWRQTLSAGDWTDGLDISTVSGHAMLRAIPFATLESLVPTGVRVEVQVTRRSWSAAFVGIPYQDINVTAGAELFEVFGDDELTAAETARDTSDVAALYELCGHLEGTFRISIEPDATRLGFHWVRIGARLSELLTSEGLGTLTRLCAPDTPPRLLVMDAGHASLVTTALLIHGPEQWSEQATEPVWTDGARRYWETFLGDRQPSAPPPTALSVVEQYGFDNVSRLLCYWCHALAWWWLATGAVQKSDRLQLHFEGARSLDVTLVTEPLTDCRPSLQVWRWATETADFDRREALQRSVSLAVFDAADLRDSAPILRNAKWLFDLARRDAVAEAGAARRTAREAALAVARATSDATTATGAKVLDRVIVQVAAAAGILVAQAKALLDAPTAARLLAAVIGLLLVTGLVAVFIDFPAARRPIRNFRADLQLYREVLSQDDLDVVSGMQSVTAAERQVQKQRAVAGVVVVLVTGLVLWTFIRVTAANFRLLF